MNDANRESLELCTCMYRIFTHRMADDSLIPLDRLMLVWNYLKAQSTHVPHNLIGRVMRLQNVASSHGKCKALIRMSLNLGVVDQLLEAFHKLLTYIDAFSSEHMYSPYAFLLSGTSVAEAVQTLQPLVTARFDFAVDQSSLDGASATTRLTSSPSPSPSSIQSPVVSPSPRLKSKRKRAKPESQPSIPSTTSESQTGSSFLGRTISDSNILEDTSKLATASAESLTPKTDSLTAPALPAKPTVPRVSEVTVAEVPKRKTSESPFEELANSKSDAAPFSVETVGPIARKSSLLTSQLNPLGLGVGVGLPQIGLVEEVKPPSPRYSNGSLSTFSSTSGSMLSPTGNQNAITNSRRPQPQTWKPAPLSSSFSPQVPRNNTQLSRDIRGDSNSRLDHCGDDMLSVSVPLTSFSLVDSYWGTTSQSDQSPVKSLGSCRMESDEAPLSPDSVVHSVDLQVHFTIHVPEKLAGDEFACGWCGRRRAVSRGFDLSRTARYCHYTGRYCCSKCHSDDERILPGYVVQRWSFKKFPVCKLASHFLDDVLSQPCINLRRMPPHLVGKHTNSLQPMVGLRREIALQRALLLECDTGLAEGAVLVPPHFLFLLTAESYIYSLESLIGARQGSFLGVLRELSQAFSSHITRKCAKCREKGRQCFMSRDPRGECFGNQDEILFPFERAAKMCGDCGEIFHAKCFRSKQCLNCGL
eukprot:c10069_g1_i1.p1 GENE.c10069_g1_i1~~c10069_g1_i1.p1  ORF type:complete len:757 (+),score=89.84 c10069_g1_i1:173-2272(+)